MGKCKIEFEVYSKFTINIEINPDEFIDQVEDDIKTIVHDYDAQIEDMINGSRKPKLTTQHGHVINLVTSRDVRLSDTGKEDLSLEINKENIKYYGI